MISTTFDQRLPFVQPNQFGLDEESALERNKQIIADSSVDDFGFRVSSTKRATVASARCQPCWPGERRCPRRVRRPGSDVDRLDRHPERRHSRRFGGHRVDRRHGLRLTDNLYIATQNWDWQWGRPVPLPMEGETATVEPSTGAVGAPEVAAQAPDPSAETTATTAVTESTPSPVTTDVVEPPDTTPESTPDTTEVAPSTTSPMTFKVRRRR